MGWWYLIIAGIFEVIWAVGLKYSNGFTKLGPSVFTLVTMSISIACLSYAIKTIPLANAYAIWTGIGAVGVTIFGIVWLNESADIKRLMCILLIILGIIGLKLLAPPESSS